MVEWLHSILTQIADGTLLPATYYAKLDCNRALDARDSDAAFDSEWGRLSKEVASRWEALTLDAETRALAEDIRRESFLSVSRATKQHEIASYVSDDFELIVKGRLVGAECSFLSLLWDIYQRGEFPSPQR